MSAKFENLPIILFKCHSLQCILAFLQTVVLMKYTVSEYSLRLTKLTALWHAFRRVSLYIRYNIIR